MTLKKKAFENIVGEGESDGNPHFLFPIMFCTFSKSNSNLLVTSENAYNLDQPIYFFVW